MWGRLLFTTSYTGASPQTPLLFTSVIGASPQTPLWRRVIKYSPTRWGIFYFEDQMKLKLTTPAGLYILSHYFHLGGENKLHLLVNL